MSFPAYSNMTGSGIEWVGDVPSHWVRQPLFALVAERNESNEGMIESNLLSLSYGRIVRKDIENNDGLLPTSFETYQVVEPNDIVWRLTDLQNDQRSLRTGIVRERGIITSAYLATQPRAIIPNYLSYLLRAYDLTKVFYSMGGGLRQSMKFADVKWLPVMLPPANEQMAIAAFLDRETAKIDALIEEQRRLIALLKEKRQAVISHAVTKGLDPHAPMKDSGIEWLGKVPAHWKVAPLKRVIQTATSGPRGWSDLLGSEGGIFFQSQNIGTDMNVILDGAARIAPPAGPDTDRASLRIGDVVVCITGGRTGAVSFVDRLPDAVFVNQHVCLVRPRPGHASGHFISFALFCEIGQKQLAVATYGLKQGLSLGNIRDLIMPIPPFIEQEQIAASLTSRFDDFDALMADAMKAVVLLSERRSALISAAVTGKIDVRHTAKVLPLPISRARARGLVATEIIERSAHQPTFGRVKFQKIAFLAEAHVGIGELEGCYIREAAGPLDRALIDEMESGARSVAGIEIDQPGGPGTTVSYHIGPGRGAHRRELSDWLGPDRTAKLDKLIDDCASLTTKQAEAVATLYGVWNDALAAGTSPTDAEIISGFLNDWHPEKREKFRASELSEWLGWMRRQGIVPSGSGPRTTTGRLFA